MDKTLGERWDIAFDALRAYKIEVGFGHRITLEQIESIAALLAASPDSPKET